MGALLDRSMIEIPDRACHDYLRQFNLGCIFVTVKGKIGAGSDLVHAEQPIWCMWCNSRRSAEEILTAVNDRYSGTESATRAIAAAADRLGIQLSSHCTVMARTKAVVAALDKRLSSAQQTGALAFVNREYQRRRLEAAKSGAKFMSYSEAQRRLRKALATAAATGSMPKLMTAVFGDGTLLGSGMCNNFDYLGRGKNNHVGPHVEHCVVRREQHQPNITHLTVLQEDVMSETFRVFDVGPKCASKASHR
jgi:hypothetical protein